MFSSIHSLEGISFKANILARNDTFLCHLLTRLESTRNVFTCKDKNLSLMTAENRCVNYKYSHYRYCIIQKRRLIDYSPNTVHLNYSTVLYYFKVCSDQVWFAHKICFPINSQNYLFVVFYYL